MQQNLVSHILSKADFDAIMSAYDLIQAKIAPFAIDLDNDDRQSLFKQGPKSQNFVQGINALAHQSPTSVPADIDMPEFDKDTALSQQMFLISQKSTFVDQRITDTLTAVGSDCMGVSVVLYRIFRALGLSTTVLDDLGQRFAKKAAATAPVAPAK